MNSDFMTEYSDRFAQRVIQESGPSSLEQAQTAWRIAFGSSPTADQETQLKAFIDSQEAALEASPQGEDKPGDPRHEALKTTCRALLASNGYLYID